MKFKPAIFTKFTLSFLVVIRELKVDASNDILDLAILSVATVRRSEHLYPNKYSHWLKNIEKRQFAGKSVKLANLLF